jgi:hypothetical protein
VSSISSICSNKDDENEGKKKYQSMLPQTLEQVTVIHRFILVASSAALAWLTDLRKTMKKTFRQHVSWDRFGTPVFSLVWRHGIGFHCLFSPSWRRAPKYM